MHHSFKGMIGQRTLAQHLAASGCYFMVVLHRAAADADCSELDAVLDDRQSAWIDWYQTSFWLICTLFCGFVVSFCLLTATIVGIIL
jgi:hypothetical protein